MVKNAKPEKRTKQELLVCLCCLPVYRDADGALPLAADRSGPRRRHASHRLAKLRMPLQRTEAGVGYGARGRSPCPAAGVRTGTADLMTASEIPAVAPRGRLAAIAIMCLASLCFIAMHTFVKTVRGEVPVGVILWSQYAFQAGLLTLLFAPRLKRMVTTRLLGLQLLRTLALMTAIGSMFVAVGLMQLADAIAIAFVAPLLITGLSVIFLKETVTRAHWLAILVGFAGVLIVIRPGASVFEPASLIPLGAAFCVAVYQTLTRPISLAVAPAAMLYMATLIGLVVSSLALPFTWEAPAPRALGFLAAAAGLGAAAHFLLIKAYQAAPASVVAPFAYSELIWASALGLAVFGDVPDPMTLTGGVVLAASGLYLLRRQSRAAVA